jgi:hypothetical protein
MFVGAGANPIRGGLTIGEAEDGDLVAGFYGEHESSAKGEAFVVRMCGDAEEFARRGCRHVCLKRTACSRKCEDSSLR